MADFARLSVAATFHMVPWYSYRKWQKNKPERKMLNLVIPYPTRSSSLTFLMKRPMVTRFWVNGFAGGRGLSFDS